MISRKHLAGGFLIAIGLSLGFGIGSLRADGVPQTTPLFYSGTLTEAGQPVTGARNIRISLWKHETDTTVANRTCETVANNTPVEGGRFRVTLDPACVLAVHAEPEQWVEVLVGSDIIGTRAKLGAVPYALEADRAANAPVVTAWQAYTPPVTAGGTAIPGAVAIGSWRRVGDSVQVHIETTFADAPAAAGGWAWGLPDGLQVDLAKYTFTFDVAGIAVFEEGGTEQVFRVSTNAVNTTRVGINALPGGPTNAAQQVGLSFTLPIQGWGITQ